MLLTDRNFNTTFFDPPTPKPQEISKEKLENLHLLSKEEQADLRRQLDDTITYYNCPPFFIFLTLLRVSIPE